MKNKIFTTIQIITGLMLLVFGLNTFLQFIPMPQASEQMEAYTYALFSTGFIFPIIAIIEIISGIAFIINKFTSLMAILIMPIILNALLAHMFLDPSGIGASLFITLSIIVVMIKNKDSYISLLKV
jgi:uncharacterized membrane protein YphA (DoxX/SURF4 family)